MATKNKNVSPLNQFVSDAKMIADLRKEAVNFLVFYHTTCNELNSEEMQEKLQGSLGKLHDLVKTIIE